VIARTSRNTGVSVGPLGLIVFAIGGLIALVLAAVVVLAAGIAAAAMFTAGEVRRRRAAPRVAARRG
jgi:hypothetical protein